MASDYYSQSGLPANPKFRIAAAVCYGWLEENMKAQFGEEGIQNFMKNQPLKAAKRILDLCDNPSEESVIVTLLGPAKSQLIAPSREEFEAGLQQFLAQTKQTATPEEFKQAVDRELAAAQQAEVRARKVFGDRTIDLIRNLFGAPETDADMPGDATRIAMVEALSGMGDQIIDRKKIDRMHDIRWNMVKNYEALYQQAKGQNPGLDPLFEESLQKSRDSLEKLDREAATAKKNNPKPPGL